MNEAKTVDQPAVRTRLDRLIERLQRIAIANRDVFRYRIEIESIAGRLRYRFVCEETADRREFLLAVGDTMDAAVGSADSGIVQSCVLCGYLCCD